MTRPAEPALYRPFLVTALVATLTLGSTFGAYNLLMLHWALGSVPSAHHASHAQFQVWGFVFLFIMGVSYHAAPRLLRSELKWPALARGTLWLAVGGLVLHTRGHLSGLLAPAPEALLASGVLQLLAVLLWLVVLTATWRAAPPPRADYVAFLAVGSCWWLLGAGLSLAAGIAAVARGLTHVLSGINESIYAATLLGGALGWIYGMGVRMVRGFLALPAPRPAALRAAFWLAQTGAALATAGPLWSGASGRIISDLGLLAAAVGLLSFVVALRPFYARVLPSMSSDPTTPVIVRAAFVGALVFVVSGSTYATLDLLGLSPSRLLYDSARHALTLGFVALMIFGVAGRIVAAFRSVPVRWPGLRRWGAWLIAAGVVLRQAEVAAAYLHTPWLLYISGASGIVAALGVWLASLSILATLATRSPRRVTA